MKTPAPCTSGDCSWSSSPRLPSRSPTSPGARVCCPISRWQLTPSTCPHEQGLGKAENHRAEAFLMRWPWGRSGEADGAQGSPELLFLGWQWARLSPLKASPPGLCGELLRGLCSPPCRSKWLRAVTGAGSAPHLGVHVASSPSAARLAHGSDGSPLWPWGLHLQGDFCGLFRLDWKVHYLLTEVRSVRTRLEIPAGTRNFPASPSQGLAHQPLVTRVSGVHALMRKPRLKLLLPH